MDDELLTIPDLTDDLGRQVIDAATKAKIADTFATIAPGKRGAFLVIADAHGNAQATVAAKIGEHWKVAAGASYRFGEKRPTGYVGIEGSW